VTNFLYCLMISGWLEEERVFVCHVRLTRDPHDPEVDGVWVVCLTVVFLELWGYEPDIVVVIRWYQDVWWELHCLWILRHDLWAPRAWYQGHYCQLRHWVEVHWPIAVETQKVSRTVCWSVVVYLFIYFYSKTNQMYQCIKLFCFGMTLYMFRTVFRPSPGVCTYNRHMSTIYCCLLAGVQECTYSNRHMSNRHSCLLASK